VLKNMDVAVFDTVTAILDGSFEGGLYLGTLENNGVGLASFHDLESMVPEGLAAELEEVTAGIIAGDIQTQP